MSERARDRLGRPLPPGSADTAASLETPESHGGSTIEIARRGFELFYQQRFFEAHEFFEFVWKATDVGDGDRPFWKGVTQIAVGCCHAQRGNKPGALAVLARGADLLRQFPSPHLDIDSVALVATAEAVVGLS